MYRSSLPLCRIGVRNNRSAAASVPRSRSQPQRSERQPVSDMRWAVAIRLRIAIKVASLFHPRAQLLSLQFLAHGVASLADLLNVFVRFAVSLKIDTGPHFLVDCQRVRTDNLSIGAGHVA